MLTLGVSDLEKSVAFYRDGMDLHTEGIIGKEFEHGAVAFFDLQGGLTLALWPRKSIAHDTNIPLQSPSSTEFTIGHNLGSREEVDALMEQSKKSWSQNHQTSLRSLLR